MRENDLIRTIRDLTSVPDGARGIGDDCCEWTPGGRTCLSVDALVEGVHFLATDDPRLIGGKAAGAALSDLAAAGAKPVGAVVALSVPSHWNGLAVMEGLIAELARHGCPLLGGDTTSAQQLTISVTVWGEAAGHRLLHRSGAQAGDLLVVTGPLGGSLVSGRHLRPAPRFAEGHWLAASPYVHACMDLTDGLASDAPKLAEASGTSCLLLPNQVPVHPDAERLTDPLRAACCDGEDFELLAAVSAEQWMNIQLAWPFEQRLALVGWLTPEPGHTMEDAYGRRVPLTMRGYEHGAG